MEGLIRSMVWPYPKGHIGDDGDGDNGGQTEERTSASMTVVQAQDPHQKICSTDAICLKKGKRR